jgi:hypothetical protein
MERGNATRGIERLGGRQIEKLLKDQLRDQRERVAKLGVELGDFDAKGRARGVERLGVKQIEKWLRDQRERAAQMRAAGKPVPAGQKLPDGGGLYLTYLPSGRASWQVRYAFGGKAGTYSIGLADDVTLAEARGERARIKDLVDQGVDPVTERRAKRAEGVAASEETFESVAELWLAKQKLEWSDVHYIKSARALQRDVYPTLGKLPVARITVAMVAGVIDRIQKRGVRETAQKVLQHVSRGAAFARPRRRCSSMCARCSATRRRRASASTTRPSR